ncbi:MAG TPA: acyltransferase [Puia sp.]|nr:acyltransferase [Puia sp.]
MKNYHLPGLNGIRAIACIMVFYHHVIATFAGYYSFPHRYTKDLGPYGVTCFFTLSGFLITTLLLKEKKRDNSINLRKFYIRRILRIWPLYFMILLIGRLIFIKYPQEGEQASNFYFYLFFVGNLGYSLGHAIWTVNVLWSVGVEEQFYAIWPFFIRTKHILRSIIVFIVAYLGIKLYGKHLGAWQDDLISNTRLDCMAIGGLFAYANFKGWSRLDLFYSRNAQIAVWIIFASAFIRRFHIITFFDHEIFSIIVGIIILNVSCNPATLFSLENRILNYLGKISYGIYAYHMLIILGWRGIFVTDHPSNPGIAFFLPFILLGITILLAHVSYFYFEKRFLEIKHRFSTIPSAA